MTRSRPFLESPAKLALLAVGLLLVLLTGIGVVQHRALTAELAQETAVLHRLASQRADQHDAHLTALSAIAVSSDDPEQRLFQEVAASITRFYPRISAIALVPLQPEGSGAGATLDPALAAQVRAAVLALGGAITLLPDPTRTGHYIMVKRSPNSADARNALILSIDAARLLDDAGPFWNRPGVGLALSLPDGMPLFRRGTVKAAGQAKVLGSVSQPLRLDTARSIAVALGPAATASRFTVSNLEARLGGRDIAGRFTGADVRLARVPLDLRDASGNWRYAGGALNLAEGDFRLVDRQADARFEPLVARDGTLRLADNIVTARALLRNPATDRVVTEVDLTHNLAAGRGHADLTVPGLLFDRQLQPVALSQRALGVIANARGTITGTGRIDWGPAGVTSTGEFSSDGLDLAAAFGPVRGARGTVRFTDLIGLTTAPGQTLQVASVNPGIEVTDGEFTFQLRGGRMLAVEGGSWPFMGGRLILKQVDLNFGVDEARRYEFEIVGLDAATFIARFELPNIAATGTFDGTVPIVFDASGNGRVEGGLLTSRPPGGNVSYVGDLTYKDLSPIANFAFDTLRSLDYDRMTIGMNGALTGEIVTNVNIEGVRQGAGAKRNIITRALANLPIQFRINITAPFYQLITSFKSLRDPAAVRDPRDLGLLSDDGTRLKPAVRAEDVPVKVKPEDLIPGKPPVQK